MMKSATALLLLAAVASASFTTLSMNRHNTHSSQPSRAVSALRAMYGTDGSGTDTPIGGDVYPVAIYWTKLSVGTPAVEFPVALDTGSFTLDIPAKGCDGCITKAPNAQYDASASSTSSPVSCSSCPGSCFGSSCTFSNTYETCNLQDPSKPCTISGNWYSDVVTLGGLPTTKVDFGVITKQTAHFYQFENIDGVMGLSGSPGSTNVVTSMVQSGALKEDIIAMCLYEGSKSNGTLTLGGIDEDLYTGDIAWAADVGSNFRVLNLTRFAVGGDVVPSVATSNCIVDSGTNTLLLPNSVYGDFISAVQQVCKTKQLVGACGSNAGIFQQQCYPMTAAQVADFPSLKLQLEGDAGQPVTLDVGPEQYLYNNGTDRCMGVRRAGSSGFTIVGDVIMEPYYVIFDRSNGNKRMGWAAVNKDNCGSK